MKLYVFVLLFGFASAICSDNCRLRIIDSIRSTPQCLREGGMCTIAVDCPRGQLTKERGLCSGQRINGVECCFGISLQETRCQKLGGNCFSSTESNCKPDQTTKRARDCEQGFKCCALV